MDLAEGLKQLRWAAFEVTLIVAGHLRLPPYKGSVLRGAFGATFKRLVCVMPHRNCGACLLKQQCVYAVDFESPARTAETPGAYMPHPFIIEPPPEARTEYRPGDILTFGLVLVGRAIDHLPYFIYTLDEMGKAGLGRGRGQCRIDEVRHIGTDGARTRIYDGTEKQLATGWPVSLGESFDGGFAGTTVDIEFLSPTRIRVKNDLLLDLDFETLVRALLRRLSLLVRHHCEGRMDLDFRGMVDRSKSVETARRELRWHDWERYSARQNTTMKMGGFVGRISFEGAVGKDLPLLRAGESLHVGKGTAFGLGRYHCIS